MVQPLNLSTLANKNSDLTNSVQPGDGVFVMTVLAKKPFLLDLCGVLSCYHGFVKNKMWIVIDATLSCIFFTTSNEPNHRYSVYQ